MLTRPLTKAITRPLTKAITQAVGGGAAAWSPSSLFASGEQGAAYWITPDFFGLFQDAAGTTPVTAVEQPVGKILDRSGRGNHATQATAASRPKITARKNLLLATTTLATQSVTCRAAQHTLSFKGTGTVTLSGASTAGPLVGTGANDRVSLTFTPTAGSVTFTVSGSVTEAQLEYGAAATTYQRVTTATDYDTAGFPHRLKFDGVDDFLATGNVDFTATDKMTVVAGVRSNSNAYSNIVELGPNSGAENGFSLQRGFAGGGDYAGIVYGTSQGYGFTSNFAAPDTSVVVAQYDIAQASVIAGELAFRRNGVVAALVTGAGSAGTGNFTSKPLYIGARAGTSFPFNGEWSSLVVRGAASTTGEIEAAEAYAANLNGVTL